ncbi:MAG: ATP-dependent RecD-like DNA helicase [Streptococcaceae bacterium]|nr:ATP-dependent RecD-like DNA helicase [Streptococcaceae bacterium]
MTKEKKSLTGTIQSIFFSNPSNFYKVILVEVEETNFDYEDTEIVVTGTIGDVVEGGAYTFWGETVTHPKYGEQLTVERYDKAVPTSKAGLVRYFASDKFPGIGKKTAEKIVELFPTNTVDAILQEPDKLKDLLTLAKKNSFVKRLRDNHGMEKILSQLAEYELPNKLTFQIYEKYKEETLEIIEKNPYQLVEDIKGVGFKTADKIAKELGIKADSPERYRAGLMHVATTQPVVTGDTYIEAKALLNYTLQLLEESQAVQLDAEDVAEQINELLVEGKIQAQGTKIFENSLYFAEIGIENSIKKLLNRKADKISTEKLNTAISEVEEDLSIQYDDLQKKAIINAMNHQFSILTGGPGTGKTTIINGFIEVFSRIHGIDLDTSHYTDDIFPILLAAPTGRASRRMNELTGLPAGTLHRHLGLGQGDDVEDDFSDDLSGSLLIVDEFSMVDTWLANKLFQAIPPSMKVLIVGDADQLPSVGPGQVFADLFHIADVPSITLDKIFRQSEDSTITDLAHDIKDGQLPPDFTIKKTDTSYFEVSSHQVGEVIAQVASAWQKRGNDSFELQVLAPMYKGSAGINHLNKILQEIFNPLEDGLEFVFIDTHYRLGDKVLHLVNDATTNVFNGDLGMITELVPAKYSESKQDEIFMDFDGQEISYPRSEWYKITLAYAMSIHKAQGSEFSTVVLPMVSAYSRMLERNLLYTAITRAKQSLILLGEQSAFAQSVAKAGASRKTYLKERFNPQSEDSPSAESEEEVSQEKQLTERMILSGQIDALIGLTEEDIEIFKE